MRVVVVGGGAAGVVAARTAREHGADVVLISADEHIAYSPCAIPFVISGEIERPEDILMRDPTHYERLGIDVRLGVRVEEVDPEEKVVTTEDGDTVEYDSMVLATGGEPLVPRSRVPNWTASSPFGGFRISSLYYEPFRSRSEL